MRRLLALLFPLALLASIGVALVFSVEDSHADLDNLVFTSKPDRLRMVVPRGWRATDQPSYPGLLLWMMRSQPPGQMVLTSEIFTRELYCSWPVQCRSSREPLVQRYVCAIRAKLQQQRMRVGTTQPGPNENKEAGMPSLYFEYEDGRRFLRQAFTFTNDRFVSLVLSAPNDNARASHVHTFEQALRTLRTLTPAEAAVSIDASVSLAVEAGPSDASTLPVDSAALDAGVVFESTSTQKVDPIGPCPN